MSSMQSETQGYLLEFYSLAPERNMVMYNLTRFLFGRIIILVLAIFMLRQRYARI